MFNLRSLKIALFVATVSLFAAGGCLKTDKSNDDKTATPNKTDQIKESNDMVAKDVTDKEKDKIQFGGLTIISGVVHDQADMPVDGVQMEIFPIRDWLLHKYDEGRFEAIRQARSSSASIRGNLFVARHAQRNLVAAVELDEDTNTLNVKLEPGVILTGRVVDAKGKGIEGARIATILQGSNWRSAIPGLVMKTDEEGKFDFKALPLRHKYILTALAMGYRISKIGVNSDDAHDNRIDTGPIVLAKGEFSVSGVVVDVNDKPVPNVWVYCTGKDQVGINSHTDADGRFKADGIFEGQVQITAAIRLRGYGRWDSYGSIDTVAGATNVKVVLNNKGMPPPKGRTCFPVETDVWINGTIVNISEAARGQTVGRHGCIVPAAAFGLIEDIEEHTGTFKCRDIVLGNGNIIGVVDAHCFMLDSGQWIAAHDLKSGRRLKTLDGVVTIKSVTTRTIPFVGKVYNLKIKGSDKYTVGKDGVIVRDY